MRVSICYPPDMDTPGYAKEGLHKVCLQEQHAIKDRYTHCDYGMALLPVCASALHMPMQLGAPLNGRALQLAYLCNGFLSRLGMPLQWVCT